MSYEAALKQHYASISERLRPHLKVVPKPILLPPPIVEAFAADPIPEDAPLWKRIILEVCAKHCLSFRDVISRTRKVRFARARQECCYRLRAETDLSLPQVGRRLGCLDHTTVLHACRVHAERNGLPKLTGSIYERKWSPERTATVVKLKANHSMTQVAKITGNSVGTVAGVIYRDRQARVAHIKEWAGA